MKTGQRYGKTQLVDDVRAELSKRGIHITVRISRAIVDTVLTCCADGLRENGNLTIDKIGSLSIESNGRATETSSKLRIKYRTTDYIRKLLQELWSAP